MGLFSLFKPNVKKMRVRKDVEGLAKVLNHSQDWWCRVEVADALGEIGDRRAVEPLTEALRDERALVRFRAAHALGRIGDRRAIGPLTEAMKDDAWDFQGITAIVAELNLLDGRDSLEPINRALRDGSLSARDVARQLAEKHGIAVTSAIQKLDLLNVRVAIVWALGVIGGDAAIGALAKALQNENDIEFRRLIGGALKMAKGEIPKGPLFQACTAEQHNGTMMVQETKTLE